MTTEPEAIPAVDELAQEIRRVDGSNSLGAGALAEALMPFLIRASRAPVDGAEAKPVAWETDFFETLMDGTLSRVIVPADKTAKPATDWKPLFYAASATHPAPASPDAEMPIASNGGANLPELLAAVEGIWPGSFWHLAKGRISFDEPLFGFQVLFGTGEVLAEGEGNSAVSAISAAIANAEGRS